MPLESLLELVETLGDRIDRHGPALKQSEALTRYALIDPLLRELGWDTSDPGMVMPEYKSGSGRADYALMNGDSPAIMLEAKSLDTNLEGAVLSQGIQYCLEQGTMFFCVTDGRRWEIYETHKPVPMNDKRIVSFDIKDSPAQACLNALALWRPGVETGQANVGKIPISKPEPIILPPPVVPPIIQDGWHNLEECVPTAGQKTAGIMFPDKSHKNTNNWRDILVETVRWLTDKNLLSAVDCPVKSTHGRSFRYMVHTQPVHSNGNGFSNPLKVNGLYVERHDNLIGLRNKTMTIIQHVHQDPAQFKVRLP